MSSQIIAFVVGHWEDLLIALAVGVAILLFDYFVLRKRRTDSKTSNDLIATDRLIALMVVVCLIVFYVTQQSATSTGGLYIMGAFVVVLITLISQRQRYLNNPPKSKEPVKAAVQTIAKDDIVDNLTRK